MKSINSIVALGISFLLTLDLKASIIDEKYIQNKIAFYAGTSENQLKKERTELENLAREENLAFQYVTQYATKNLGSKENLKVQGNIKEKLASITLWQKRAGLGSNYFLEKPKITINFETKLVEYYKKSEQNKENLPITIPGLSIVDKGILIEQAKKDHNGTRVLISCSLKKTTKYLSDLEKIEHRWKTQATVTAAAIAACAIAWIYTRKN